MQDLQYYTDQAMRLAVVYAPQLLLAIATLLVGLWIIRILVRILNNGLVRANIEPSLHGFLASLASILLKALLLISVAAMVGIETTSFIAVLGAAGLAVGLALQGSLANFAGGVLILWFKPFRVGDFIEAQGHSGSVHAIQVFNTLLKTPDNRVVIIPNGALSNGSITNFSAEATRRVDMVFGIGYGDDIAKARQLLNQLIGADERILKEPASQVVVGELGDSSVNFKVRVWCKTSDYWGVYFDMHENVKLTFDREGVSIPFPQRDVHLFQEQPVK